MPEVYDQEQDTEVFEVTETEGDRVFNWRVEQFQKLGFDATDASDLAYAPCDLNIARNLIADGCPCDIAREILL